MALLRYDDYNNDYGKERGWMDMVSSIAKVAAPVMKSFLPRPAPAVEEDVEEEEEEDYEK